jgi:chorismate mutase
MTTEFFILRPSLMNFTPLQNIIPNLSHPLVIAGPCSAEGADQVLATAKELEKNPLVRVFRAGIWKPRTRPNCFEGVGEIGLEWLKLVKQETRLLTCTEVAKADHVEMALKAGVDMLWLGARTTVGPFAVQEIADALKGVDIPVMIKNPINADLALWSGAIERIHKTGINKIIAIHRGFSSYGQSVYRNSPLWHIPIELIRRFPDLPVICDPSHIAGKRSFVQPISQMAMDLNMAGLMIETHLTPEKAWSDAAQQVTPGRLQEILDQLFLREPSSNNSDYQSNLESLRKQIDNVDHAILESLKNRMEIVKKIGKEKFNNKVTPLQVERMNSLLNDRIDFAKNLGLDQSFIKELYEGIHRESIKIQGDLAVAKNSDNQSS